MMRLIDADVVLQKLALMLNYCESRTMGREVAVLFQAGDAVMDCPTIEAEHGRWMNILIAKIDTTGDCTNCGQEAVWRTRNKPYAICPNCGCKMDGDSHAR